MLAKRRESQYGMSREQFDALLESQGGKCAICKSDKAGGRGDWHVDHDHGTNEIRGLLCHSCNVGLGHFDDNAQLLMDAVLYITKTAAQIEQLSTQFHDSEVLVP